jgi:ech hydrogenase subunit F
MMETVMSVMRRALQRPATRRYPAQARTVLPGSRGAIDMDPDVCIYCGLCQKRCPAGAIAVTRKPNSWSVDPYACVLCSYCVEVCPVKCIRMEVAYRPPSA